MLELLIMTGRWSVVLAGAVTVVAATVAGGIFGAAHNAGILGAVAGCVGGTLIAGSVFGLAAAVFDMQRSLRHIAGSPGKLMPEVDWERADLNRSMAARIEPNVEPPRRR